ncbi:hypothetical protein SLE2022_349720 [Rubroshorea leprosula]
MTDREHTNCGNSSHNRFKLELIQNGRLTNSIRTLKSLKDNHTVWRREGYKKEPTGAGLEAPPELSGRRSMARVKGIGLVALINGVDQSPIVSHRLISPNIQYLQ